MREKRLKNPGLAYTAESTGPSTFSASANSPKQKFKKKIAQRFKVFKESLIQFLLQGEFPKFILHQHVEQFDSNSAKNHYYSWKVPNFAP